MEASTMGPVSHGELRRLAIKLREVLINCEGKLGATREFAELMDTAGALIIAIIEPEEYRVSAREVKSSWSFLRTTIARPHPRNLVTLSFFNNLSRILVVSEPDKFGVP
jgi:hypothetical protein